MNYQPFIKLKEPRRLSGAGLPKILADFYRLHEGVGLESSSDYPVRLCKLDQLRKWTAKDSICIDSSDEGWRTFTGIYIGVGNYGDAIIYVLKSPAAAVGSIMTFGPNVAGPGGTGENALESSLVLASSLENWLTRLAEDHWEEYGLIPGGIRQLPINRRKYLYQYFLRLNPEIDWE